VVNEDYHNPAAQCSDFRPTRLVWLGSLDTPNYLQDLESLVAETSIWQTMGRLFKAYLDEFATALAKGPTVITFTILERQSIISEFVRRVHMFDRFGSS